MADALLLNISKTTEYTDEPFVKKDVVYIIDSNNGSYSNNQIIFDLAGLSNSDRWCDFKNSYIAVPLIITLRNSTTPDMTGFTTDFAVAMKNGFHQIVNSMVVQYNKTTCVQQTNLTNMYVSFKLNTTLSLNDVATIGPSIGFSLPDNPNSWAYSATATINGWGQIQNDDDGTTTNPTIAHGSTSNLPLLQRQVFETFATSQTGTTTLLGSANNAIQVFGQYGRAYTYKNATGQTWQFVAQIRMKDICDFFDKIPLVKRAYLNIWVYLNQSLTTITSVAPAAGPPAVAGVMGATTTIYGGQTCPVMVAGGGAGMGFNPALDSANGTWIISCSVLNSLDTALTATPALAKNQLLNQCRFYCDTYQMTPQAEAEYVADREKTIIYEDIFQYQVLNQTGQINQLITQGIKNATKIVVCPLISSGTNPTANATFASPFASPFSASPGSLSPLMYFTNFNIQVAGINLFNYSYQYGF